MAYDFPELCVLQARWFAEELTPDGVRWSPWKDVMEWEFLAILDRIKDGERYQVRILHQQWIKGYGVDYNASHPEIQVNPGL